MHNEVKGIVKPKGKCKVKNKLNVKINSYPANVENMVSS